MKGSFNSSFVDIQTFEGEKFLKDLKPGDLILTKDKTFSRLYSIEQRLSNPKEQVYTVYYHSDREGVLERVSGDLYVWNGKVKIKVRNLKKGMKINSTKGQVVVDNVEKMEAINRFFYNLQFEKPIDYYVNNICIRSNCL